MSDDPIIRTCQNERCRLDFEWYGEPEQAPDYCFDCLIERDECRRAEDVDRRIDDGAM